MWRVKPRETEPTGLGYRGHAKPGLSSVWGASTTSVSAAWLHESPRKRGTDTFCGIPSIIQLSELEARGGRTAPFEIPAFLRKSAGRPGNDFNLPWQTHLKLGQRCVLFAQGFGIVDLRMHAYLWQACMLCLHIDTTINVKVLFWEP